jgi:CheY-like chemotaxis protein
MHFQDEHKIKSHNSHKNHMQNPKKILIVEDNLEILEMLNTVIERFFVTEAIASGKKALQRLKEAPPDLAILDVNVPGVDGFSLCKILKEDPDTRHVKVMILTAAHADEKGEEMSQHAGADAFLTKPVRTQTLLEKIYELLEIPFPQK